jgi:hypothetical protein
VVDIFRKRALLILVQAPAIIMCAQLMNWKERERPADGTERLKKRGVPEVSYATHGRDAADLKTFFCENLSSGALNSKADLLNSIKNRV